MYKFIDDDEERHEVTLEEAMSLIAINNGCIICGYQPHDEKYGCPAVCSICGDANHSYIDCPHRFVRVEIWQHKKPIQTWYLIDLLENAIVRLFSEDKEIIHPIYQIMKQVIYTIGAHKAHKTSTLKLLNPNVTENIEMEKSQILHAGKRGKRFSKPEDEVYNAVMGWYKQDPWTRPTKKEYLCELYGSTVDGDPNLPVDTFNGWIKFVKNKYHITIK